MTEENFDPSTKILDIRIPVIQSEIKKLSNDFRRRNQESEILDEIQTSVPPDPNHKILKNSRIDTRNLINSTLGNSLIDTDRAHANLIKTKDKVFVGTSS